MSDTLDFDATAVKPSTGEFDPLPNDTYVLHVETSSQKEKGHSLTIKVLDGPEKGRQFFQFFNLNHADEGTRARANQDFSALCHVVNVLKPRNMQELYKIPFMGKVVVTKANGDFGPGNKVQQFLYANGKKIGEVGGVAGSITARPASAAAATTGATWARKAG